MSDQETLTDNTFEERFERLATDIDLAITESQSMSNTPPEHPQLNSLAQLLVELTYDTAIEQLRANASLFTAALPALQYLQTRSLSFGNTVLDLNTTLSGLLDELAYEALTGSSITDLEPRFEKLRVLDVLIDIMSKECIVHTQFLDMALQMANDENLGSEEWAIKTLARSYEFFGESGEDDLG